MAGCKDHLGNSYTSEAEMCKHYKVNKSLYRYRVYLYGYDIAKALTTPRVSKSFDQPCRDHNGLLFESVSAMCEAYGTTGSAFMRRFGLQEWSVERALSVELKRQREIESNSTTADNQLTIRDRCELVGLSFDEYERRMSAKGLTEEQALSMPVRSDNYAFEVSKTPVDHLGIRYQSVEVMLLKYGVSRGIFKRRLHSGWGLKEALTVKVEQRSMSNTGKPCKDHLGNEYQSVSAMCRHYGISYLILENRLRSNNPYWTEETRLTTPADFDIRSIRVVKDSKVERNVASNKSGGVKPDKASESSSYVCDHNGTEYESVAEMCSAYGVSVDTFNARIENGWALENALCLADAWTRQLLTKK